MITLNFTCLHSASFTMPTNDARHYLNGMYIEINKDKTINYITTTGDMLIKTIQENAVNDSVPMKSFIMPHTIVNPVIKQVKALKSDFKCLELNKEGDTYSLSICSHSGLDNVMHFKAIDGTFPDYNRVIPPVKPENKIHNIGLDSKLLHDIGKAFKIFKNSNKACVNLFFGDSKTSVITIGNDEPNFHAVLMPVRF